MNDYLLIYEKFKDTKDISEYIDEVQNLRYYYKSWQFQKMQEHIGSLMTKYALETFMWNSINREFPTTYEQSYFSAENFMRVQGAKLIVEKVYDFKKRLSEQETAFIESTIKLME